MPSASPLTREVTLRLWIYRLIFPVVLLFMLPAMLLRMMRRGRFRENFGERIGVYSEALRERLAGKRPVWIQSISVGETMIALKLARRLHTLDPARPILLSVTTSTGRELAEKAALPWLEIIYNPIDLASVVRRALEIANPARLVVVEGVWPVLAAEFRRRGLPVALIARLSPRSERRYRKFRWFSGPIFGLIDPICVQEPEDVERWISLGARREAVQCTGAIKFDEQRGGKSRVEEFAGFLAGLGVAPDAPVLLAGSTFAGEEGILTRVYLALREKFPGLFLILVPRHFERTPQILTELAPLHLRIALRDHPVPDADLLIVNTTGELRDWYQLATLVFMGKSLTATGGQNPVEAALAGKPVLFGPHMENFRPIVAKWLEDEAVSQVADETELQQKLETLLADPKLGRKLARRALQAVAPHQGATDRVAGLLIGG